MTSNPLVFSMLSRLDQPFTGELLFDQLPDIVYFIKNISGEYVLVNNTLVQRCGLRSKSQLIGMTAADAYGQTLGHTFAEQDDRVLETGQPLLSQLELHIYPAGDVGWCLTCKLPLRDVGGKIVGLVGASQDLRIPDVSTDEYRHVSTAVAHARSHLQTPPTVKELAEVAAMSVYQLDRRMRSVFGLTTGQWLLKLRIDSAQRQLLRTSKSICMIAFESGYADQSAFTRQFRRSTGLSPSDFRNAGQST